MSIAFMSIYKLRFEIIESIRYEPVTATVHSDMFTCVEELAPVLENLFSNFN